MRWECILTKKLRNRCMIQPKIQEDWGKKHVRIRGRCRADDSCTQPFHLPLPLKYRNRRCRNSDMCICGNFTQWLKMALGKTCLRIDISLAQNKGCSVGHSSLQLYTPKSGLRLLTRPNFSRVVVKFMTQSTAELSRIDVVVKLEGQSVVDFFGRST